MNKYEVVIERKAQKQLDKIEPARQRDAIRESIDELADEPRPSGVTKMKGQENDSYRIRVGNYRVVYTVEDAVRIVSVIAVGSRGSIYQK